MIRKSRWRSFSCAFSVGKELRMARRVVHHLREDHRPRRRQRPPRPPQVQRARVPVADGLLRADAIVDRLQRQGDFDEFLFRVIAVRSVHAGCSARASSSAKS